MSTLTLTQGTGVTLRKSGTSLIIDAEGGGGSGSSNCYVHRFTTSAGAPTFSIDAETAKTIFEEAEIPGATIILRVYTGSSNGNSEVVYVFDGTWEPSSYDGNYKELGFNSSYLTKENDKTVTNLAELKLRRNLVQATGDYEYVTYIYSRRIDPASGLKPMEYYEIALGMGGQNPVSNYPSDPDAYDILVAKYGIGEGGSDWSRVGNGKMWFFKSSSTTYTPTSGSETYTVTFVNNSGNKILTATKTGASGTWSWSLT